MLLIIFFFLLIIFTTIGLVFQNIEKSATVPKAQPLTEVFDMPVGGLVSHLSLATNQPFISRNFF